MLLEESSMLRCPSPPPVVLLTLFCVALTCPARATVFVPTDQPTIGDGLDYADATGDNHVWVEPGDYYEQEITVYAGITLEGAGAAFTRIVSTATSVALWMQPGSAVSNLTVDGGVNAAVLEGVTVGTFGITDCWFYDQFGSPIWADGGGSYDLTFERNVIVRPTFASYLLTDGSSNVNIRNNHFVGTSDDSYLELYIWSSGGGAFEVRNNIFEAGERALDVWLDPDTPAYVEVSNNVFNGNEYGISLACSNTIYFAPNIQNNWFVDGRWALYLSPCMVDVGNADWHDYNGFDNNTEDIDLGVLGSNSFHASASFVSAVADADHLSDDYQLVGGTPGIDQGNPSGFYQDVDTTTADVGAYGGPFGYSWNWDGDPLAEDQGDCDDRDMFTFTGAPEMCDGLDNDCSGSPGSDEEDTDGDGYMACEECNDAWDTIYPGAPEMCDGMDSDCDDVVPADELDGDVDGWMTCNGDCDDTDPGLHGDDFDGDMFSPCAGDCDDSNSQMWPGMEEICDGLDNDCDGAPMPDEVDMDGDGWSPCEGDCDDENDKVAPDLDEVCDDNHDNDCDGDVDAEDDDCSGGDDDDVGDDDTTMPDDDVGDDDADDDDTGVGPDEDDDLPSGLHCQCRAAASGRSPATFLPLSLALALLLRRRS